MKRPFLWIACCVAFFAPFVYSYGLGIQGWILIPLSFFTGIVLGDTCHRLDGWFNEKV